MRDIDHRKKDRLPFIIDLVIMDSEIEAFLLFVMGAGVADVIRD